MSEDRTPSGVRKLLEFIQRQNDIAALERECQAYRESQQAALRANIERLKQEAARVSEAEVARFRQRIRNLADLQRRLILELIPGEEPRYVRHKGDIWRVMRRGDDGIAERYIAGSEIEHIEDDE